MSQKKQDRERARRKRRKKKVNTKTYIELGTTPVVGDRVKVVKTLRRGWVRSMDKYDGRELVIYYVSERGSNRCYLSETRDGPHTG